VLDCRFLIGLTQLTALPMPTATAAPIKGVVLARRSNSEFTHIRAMPHQPVTTATAEATGCGTLTCHTPSPISHISSAAEQTQHIMQHPNWKAGLTLSSFRNDFGTTHCSRALRFTHLQGCRMLVMPFSIEHLCGQHFAVGVEAKSASNFGVVTNHSQIMFSLSCPFMFLVAFIPEFLKAAQ